MRSARRRRLSRAKNRNRDGQRAGLIPEARPSTKSTKSTTSTNLRRKAHGEPSAFRARPGGSDSGRTIDLRPSVRGSSTSSASSMSSTGRDRGGRLPRSSAEHRRNRRRDAIDEIGDPEIPEGERGQVRLGRLRRLRRRAGVRLFRLFRIFFHFRLVLKQRAVVDFFPAEHSPRKPSLNLKENNQ